MAFGFHEASRSKGSPVDLYYFKYGPEALDYYAFTNADNPITWQSIEYQSVPMDRDRIIASGGLDNTQLPIRTRFDNPVAELFRVYPPERPVSLVLYSGHANDAAVDFKPIWNGRILGVNWEGYEATLSGELATSNRRRPGLRRNYQYGCPHVLYGTGAGKCNANKANATVTRTLDAVQAPVVVMPLNWVPDSETVRFNNGMIEWTTASGRTEVRTILKVENLRELVLSGPPTGLGTGSTVHASYGCAHTEEACLKWHNNILNFGGCPWIPIQNPIGQVNNFY